MTEMVEPDVQSGGKAGVVRTAVLGVAVTSAPCVIEA